MPHGLVNFTAVAKANLNFGRVHIDIHTLGVHLQIQDVNGLTLTVQHIFIGTACTMRDDFVTHKAAVHIRKLLICPRPRCIGCACTTAHMDRTGSEINVDRRGHKIFAQHIGQTLVPSGFTRMAAPLLHNFAFVPNGKAHLRPNQSMSSNGFDAVRQFCVF